MKLLAVLLSVSLSPFPINPNLDPHISLSVKNWMLFTTNQPVALQSVQPFGFQFDFPNIATPNYATYLVTKQRRPISGTLTMTVRVNPAGYTTFLGFPETANVCDTPATVRPYIQGQDGTQWWSKRTAGAFYLDGFGVGTLTVPLIPDLWTGPNGDADMSPDQFDNTLDNVSFLGMVFGQGCFMGHGVAIFRGPATFQILNYSIF